jgi:hypothetical protein
MTTVTSTTSRFGDTTWAVTWGPGLTQTVICLTRAEADEVAETHRPAGGAVEPLVGFRAS